MQQNDVIAITGTAGFIGSYLVGFLNRLGYHQLILADDFSRADKQKNLEGKQYQQLVDRNELADWMRANPGVVKYMFHLGARTDTTEMDYEIHKKLNLDYTKDMWQLCVAQNIPMVYASSAATYGNGEYGYKDSHDIIDKLRPLNPYGRSKNEFDIWAIAQEQAPPFWAGLKFFNVYGPNEYHKGRMASVILHAYNQIQKDGVTRLFRSHNPNYTDGGQLRDFIYVADIANICYWLMQHQPESGLYNAGTGQARSFLSLAQALFATLGKEEHIEFIDTPLDIRDKYQYFTEANMDKLHSAGYDKPFHTLEEGIAEYVTEYLSTGKYY
jgi:ADP-L-glycero-D-manno-heptose-6-epimerase